MTESDIQSRLNLLKAEYWSLKQISEFSGFQLLPEDDLLTHYETWARENRREHLLASGGRVHRNTFENFLASNRIMPYKLAAIQVGMDEESLRDVLSELKIRKRLLQFIDPHIDTVVDGTIIERLPRMFVALQRKIFTNHDDRCRRLHEAIRDDLSVAISPVYCKTSEALQEESLLYAYEFDALTDEPMSIKYQLWLNTGKPLYLKPDATSVMTFVRHKIALEGLLVGSPSGVLDEIDQSKLS